MTKRWFEYVWNTFTQVSEAKSTHSIIYFLVEKKTNFKDGMSNLPTLPSFSHLYVLVYCQSKHRLTQFSIQTCIQFEDIHGFSPKKNIHLQRIFPAFPRPKPPFQRIFSWISPWFSQIHGDRHIGPTEIAMVLHLAQLSPELCRELSAELPSRCGAPATRNVELNDAQAGDGNFGKL